MDHRRTPADSEIDSEFAAREHDERVLTLALGSAVPQAPVAEIWKGIQPRLPAAAAPRGRLFRLCTHSALAAAAAAAVLLLAVLLFVSDGGADAPRLRLHVIDVLPETVEPTDLSREEAAEIFFGSEAPVLLGSDLASDTTGGGG